MSGRRAGAAVDPPARTGRGLVLVLSGPSGTGKTTLIRRLLRRVPGLRFSVSHTTRPPRPGERKGRDYFFVAPELFRRLREREEFLEWAEVDRHAYGTSRRQIAAAHRRGEDLLLDIDTQGAAQVRRKVPEAILIFLLPPSPSSLRDRHRRRGSDASTLRRRLGLARKEVERWSEFDYVILHARLDRALQELEAVWTGELLRAAPVRMAPRGQAAIAAAAERLGLPATRLPPGAGPDAHGLAGVPQGALNVLPRPVGPGPCPSCRASSRPSPRARFPARPPGGPRARCPRARSWCARRLRAGPGAGPGCRAW